MLATAAHAVGWPFAREGSRSIVDALAAIVHEHGGRIETGRRITSLAELPAAEATFLDLTPRQLLGLAGDRLPSSYRRWLARYRYGPGVFKVDWALRAPIPWRATECSRAGTVHLGGDLDEVRISANAAWAGEPDPRPFVLLSQPSLFDASRAPADGHVAWAYCHVPHGSTLDMADAIEAQVERFAPGFRDIILARHSLDATQLEAHDANFIGGDIGGGLQDIRQFLARPVPRHDPYRTPIRGLYLCSSSTPPGGGVHGMCGWNAARSALSRLA
jgi:phytoene dehydrogenase-like protein